MRNNAETNRRAAPSFEKFLYYPRTLADRYASNGAGGNAGTHSARTRSVRSASGTRQRKTLKARERESERERERGEGGERKRTEVTGNCPSVRRVYSHLSRDAALSAAIAILCRGGFQHTTQSARRR
jgi:hypothetical protein